MTRWRVIGVGSPQGDDALGWRVIDTLQQMPLSDSVELLSLDRPGSTLLHYLQGVDRVLLVDAAQMELPAGSIRRFMRDELPQLDGIRCLSSHGWGLHETLALAESCNLPLPRIELWLIQLAQLTPLSPLNEAMEQAVADLSQTIYEYVNP